MGNEGVVFDIKTPGVFGASFNADAGGSNNLRKTVCRKDVECTVC